MRRLTPHRGANEPRVHTSLHVATRDLSTFLARRWRKPGGKGRYPNRYLWEEFHATLEQLHGMGCDVRRMILASRAWEIGAPSTYFREAKSAARETKLCELLI